MTKRIFFTLLVILVVTLVVAVYLVYKMDQKNLGGGDQNIIYSKIASSSVWIRKSASTQILASNPGRVWAKCWNKNGLGGAWIAYDKTAASKNWGFPLAASGSFEITSPNLYVGPVYGISLTASNSFSCLESSGLLVQ